MAKKIDPIRDNYYNQTEISESISNYLFYITAILSIATVFINEKLSLQWYSVIQVCFVIALLSSFSLSTYLENCLIPIANEKRREDFLTKAYNISLNHEETMGYYNNDIADPIQMIATQLLENSLFSKNISQKMLEYVRIKSSLYLIVWLILLLVRSTKIEFIAIATQTIFGGQIITHWIKLELFSKRAGKIYSDIYRLFSAKETSNNQYFCMMITLLLNNYEINKDMLGMTLSSKIFEQLNSRVSKDWRDIKQKLQI